MIPPQLQGRLKVPAIASPLFLCSGPDLVVETSRAGMIGTFPSFNQRTSEGYEEWVKDIRSRLSGHGAVWGAQFAPHVSNRRMDEDLAITIKYEVPLLITTMGITREITDAIHAYGGLVFHDVINVRHAVKALAAGVDGIIAVSAGAGGHSGTYNPLAFIGELKPLLEDKTLILAGCISDGAGIAAAIAAGADLAYVGTRFINTVESLAQERQKEMILQSNIDDIVYSAEVDGIGACWLSQTLPNHDMRQGGAVGKMNVSDVLGEPKRWRDILSAGQGVGAIRDIPTARELVARLTEEYQMAVARLSTHMNQPAALMV